ncbi:MAG: hypothetical protein GY723_11645 [bacterium]|nr:hypothetical protein [bacterium]MCP5065136.1 hypothetical protein [bacterium]
MSCPPEWSLGAYADGELTDAERSDAEGHLVGCERCRRLVVELQAEARLVSDVLCERAPAEAPPRQVASPARGLATGFPVTLGAIASVVAVFGFLFESRLPSGVEWARPGRWLGVHEMILDVLFTMRDEVPGMVELALAIAVTASVAALITFVSSALLRRVGDSRAIGGVLLLGLGVALGDASPARAAADVRFDQSVHIAPDEVIERGLLNTGESLIIEGKVVGDVVAFSERVTIRGVVDGDVWMMGRELEVSGEVKGNLHAFGEQTRISGKVGGSFYSGSDRVTLEPEAEIARDAFVMSGRFVHDGKVGRDLTGLFSRGEIQGSVGRHAESWSEQLEVRAGTVVGGDLTAHVEDAEDVRIDESVQVAGSRDVLADDPALRHIRSSYREPAFYLWRLVWMAAAFGVGLLLLRLLPWAFEGHIASGAEFFRALGLGFAFAVLVPIGLVVLALTVVGVPLALIGASLYAMVWYLAVILVATLVGRSLTSPESGSLRDQGLALLLGLVLVTIAFHLPWIGGLVRFVGMLLGAGLVLDRVLAAWNARRSAA